VDALGQTFTPFCSVHRQFFGFVSSSVHVLQILSDDVHYLTCYSYSVCCRRLWHDASVRLGCIVAKRWVI